MKSRNYDDFDDPNLAIYNFRGYTIIKLEKKEKNVEFGKDAHMASLIPEDLILISDFLLSCHKFIKGEINDVESIDVD